MDPPEGALIVLRGFGSPVEPGLWQLETPKTQRGETQTCSLSDLQVAKIVLDPMFDVGPCWSHVQHWKGTSLMRCSNSWLTPRIEREKLDAYAKEDPYVVNGLVRVPEHIFWWRNQSYFFGSGYGACFLDQVS